MSAAAQTDLDAVKTDIEAMIRTWRTGRTDLLRHLFDTTFGADPFSGFHRGGPLTWHEAMFSKWFPHLKAQVTFGTGKRGLALWGATSFTADFFNEAGREVWEIDGPSHRSQTSRQRDARKDSFFASLGIEVVRIPNSLIETWARNTMLHVAERNLGLRDALDDIDKHRYQALRPLIHQWHSDRVGVSA